MSSTIRFYISGIIGKSVANSQIFNWGKVLAEKGLETEFVIFYRNEKEVLRMTEDATQPILKIHIVKFFLFCHFIQFFALLRIYLRARRKYKKIIFQSRTYGVGISLALLKLFPGVRVISDIRGFEIEQYQKRSFYPRFRLLVFDFYEWIFLHASNKVFCVSKPLVNILSRRYRLQDPEKFSVFGGVADANHFYFDDSIRSEMRKEIGLQDKTLLLYSGMLDKPWQQPEKYFEFFTELRKSIPDLVLVLLTPNVNLANDLRVKSGLSESSVIIRESSYPDLVRYYNMADYGLLFRKNETVNNVASPTKFAEYVLCGLPVIISANIGDYSEYIADTGHGFVIRDNDKIRDDCNEIASYILKGKADRFQISALSLEQLSKQAQVSRLMKIYQDL